MSKEIKTILKEEEEEIDNMKCPQCGIWFAKCCELKSLIRQSQKRIIKAVLKEMTMGKSKIRKAKAVDDYEKDFDYGYDTRIIEEKAKADKILKDL